MRKNDRERHREGKSRRRGIGNRARRGKRKGEKEGM